MSKNDNISVCGIVGKHPAEPHIGTSIEEGIRLDYRKGNILDDQGQETGKVRLEIKFSLAYANKPTITEGAKSDNDILEFARSLASKTADPQTGYMTTHGRSEGSFGVATVSS